MKSVFSALSERIYKKNTEKTAEAKAWRQIHEGLMAADRLADIGADLVSEGWGDHEEAYHIKDEAKANAMYEIGSSKIGEGTSILEDACHITADIEAKALILAKGNLHVRNMHKYKAKSAPLRMGPYL